LVYRLQYWTAEARREREDEGDCEGEGEGEGDCEGDCEGEGDCHVGVRTIRLTMDHSIVRPYTMGDDSTIFTLTYCWEVLY
jgi:hypothetical protein